MIANPIPYPKMKDSGVPWLGEVPEHWDVLPNRVLFGEVKERDHPEEPMLSVTITKGVIRQRALLVDSSKKDSSNQDKSAYKLVRLGDIAYNKMRAWQGAIGVSDYQGIVSPAYVVERPRKGTSSRYLHYLLRTPAFAKEAERWSYGITSDMWSLRPEHFKMIYGCLPPLHEQAAIVRYLDHADRRIRRYIRAKQKLIKLLEEQKQVLIHRAVTGWVDVRTGRPYPAYKDSGVEWLGEVPQGWQRCRLRNIVSMVTTGSRGWASYASDTGPLFIRVANLSRGSLRLRFDDLVRLDLPITSEAGRTRIEAGDLLLSVTAYIGSVGVAPEGFEEAYVSQHVARCRPLPGMHARWLGYVLLSTVGQTHGQMSLYGGTKDGLSLDDVKNYPILLPPQHEQEQAVRWIEGGLSGLVKIGDGAKRQIELVREYRTRLVADVVTGKLDVREAAARLPEVDPNADEFDAPIQAAETGVMEVEDTESAEELAMESEATL